MDGARRKWWRFAAAVVVGGGAAAGVGSGLIRRAAAEPIQPPLVPAPLGQPQDESATWMRSATPPPAPPKPAAPPKVAAHDATQGRPAAKRWILAAVLIALLAGAAWVAWRGWTEVQATSDGLP